MKNKISTHVMNARTYMSNGQAKGDITLPNEKMFHLSKLKAFADDKIDGTKKLKFVSGKVENIVGKGENAGYLHFLLFLQGFQKAFFPRSGLCYYGRPLLKAWLLPDLNTIPDNCVREISLYPSCYGIVFVQACLVQILSRSYISAIHLFIPFSGTDIVRKSVS